MAREEFDQAYRTALLARIETTLSRLLADAQLRAAQADTVFFTGGASGVPLLRQRVAAMFPAARVVEGDRDGSIWPWPGARRRLPLCGLAPRRQHCKDRHTLRSQEASVDFAVFGGVSHWPIEPQTARAKSGLPPCGIHLNAVLTLPPARPTMSGNTFGPVVHRHLLWRKPRPGHWLRGGWLPAGHGADAAWIQAELDRRKPGTSRHVTQRREPDEGGDSVRCV